MTKTKTTRSSGKGDALPNVNHALQDDGRKSKHPITLCEITRNEREEIRVCLSRYRGGMTIDIREWVHAEYGVIATRTGIAFNVRHLPAFLLAISEAMRIAESEGCLPHKEAGR